jgi:hypothetical protein
MPSFGRAAAAFANRYSRAKMLIILFPPIHGILGREFIGGSITHS